MAVVDPHEIEAVSADLMTEGREFNGICALSFATVVSTPNGDGSNSVEAIVCARLRLSLATALGLRNVLDRILKTATPPKRETH